MEHISILEQVLPQLSVLVVLTSVSVAIIQYLFINHQARLRDLVASLEAISFDENNGYDKQLKRRWEREIIHCKDHTYFINPNNLILIGFAIIISLVLIYVLVTLPFYSIPLDWLNWIIIIISWVLLVWVIANYVILQEIFKKEALIKSEFHDIKNQHDLVDKVLNKVAP